MDLKALLPLVVQVSLILAVASIGLQAKWTDVGVALRHPRAVLRAIIAINVAVPLAAILLVQILPISPPVKVGIVLMAVSPLAAFTPGKMLQAGADRSLAIGLYILLVLLTVLVVPATFALLTAMFAVDVTLPVAVLAGFILTSVLLPLAGGMLIAILVPAWAPQLAQAAGIAGSLLLLPVLAALLFKAGGPMASLIGDGSLLAIAATVAAGLAAGHWLGGPHLENRMALAAAAATRHPGIAGLVAHRHFDDPRVMLAALLFLLSSMVVAAVYKRWAKTCIAGADQQAAA